MLLGIVDGFGGDEMEEQIFKTKRVGLMGKRELGPEYMLDVIRRVKRIEEALRTERKGDKQLRLFK